MEEEYTFRGKRSDEDVLIVMNEHAWTMMPIAYIWILAGALIMISLKFFGASSISSIVTGVSVAISVLYSAYKYYIWYAGFYIVTNQRVIKNDQLTLFSRKISEAEIDRIQEISTNISGPIRTMFNFGTIKIQTASSTGQLDLVDIPNPYDVQQQIARVQKQKEVKTPTAAVLR